MRIDTVHLENWRVFRDAQVSGLPGLSVFIGANGTGKSTLLDSLRFLQECATFGMETALENRGGVESLKALPFGEEPSGETRLSFRFVGLSAAQSLTYTMVLDSGKETGCDETVACEVDGTRSFLVTLHEGEGAIQFRGFLDDPTMGLQWSAQASGGAGSALHGLTLLTKDQSLLGDRDREWVRLVTGILSEVREGVRNLRFHDIRPDAVRDPQTSGAGGVGTDGRRAAAAAHRLWERHPEIFARVLDRLKRWIPGLDDLTTTLTEDRRVLLRFRDRAYRDPFDPSSVSDGTLKLFALLVLLHDPDAPKVLLVEEPENYLHPELLMGLAEEFRGFAERGGQVVCTTHSPDFVNALRLEELFWLVKETGASRIVRAADHPHLQDLVEAGDLPGYLWQQRLLSGAGLR